MSNRKNSITCENAALMQPREIIVRGMCGVCGNPVRTDQPRCKDPETNVYYHLSLDGSNELMTSDCLNNNPWNWYCVVCRRRLYGSSCKPATAARREAILGIWVIGKVSPRMYSTAIIRHVVHSYLMTMKTVLWFLVDPPVVGRNYCLKCYSELEKKKDKEQKLYLAVC